MGKAREALELARVKRAELKATVAANEKIYEARWEAVGSVHMSMVNDAPKEAQEIIYKAYLAADAEWEKIKIDDSNARCELRQLEQLLSDGLSPLYRAAVAEAELEALAGNPPKKETTPEDRL